MKSLVVGTFLVICTLLLGACRAEPTAIQGSTGAAIVSSATLRQVVGSRPASFDEQMLSLAHEAPGFAGITVDDSQLVVHVTARGNRSRVEAAVRAWVSPRGAYARSVRWQTVRFDFATLYAIRHEIRPLQVKGLIWIDIDEATDRVVIAVHSASDVAAARKYLASGVVDSLDAVDVVVSPRPRQASTLSDLVRPVMGGLRFVNENAGPGPCSMGAILRVSGSSNRYMLTASHCTNISWQLDGSLAHQPFVFYPWGTNVGTEVVDPTPQVFGYCLTDDPCRFSDAAVYQLSDASTPFKIAKTTWFSTSLNTPGSTIISSEGPFSVTGTVAFSNLVVGQGLHKVGKTTGWTFGPVTQTCVDFTGYYDLTTPFILTCQFGVGLTADGGDSGAPIFQWFGGAPTYDVYLAGILWSGGPTSGPTGAWFSPWQGVLSDLGNFVPNP